MASINSLSSSLFTNINSKQTTTFTPTTLGSDLLLAISQSKSGTLGAVGAPTSASAIGKAVEAPWADPKAQTPASKLLSDALAGKPFFDASTKTYPTLGLTADSRDLFALHAGINKLSALVGRYSADGVTSSEQARIAAAFTTGLGQLDSFLASAKFSALSLVRGAALTQATSTAAVGSTPHDYKTDAIINGDPSIANGAFDGPIQFSMDGLNTHGDPAHVDIDLADMGATPRSLDNVVFFINSKLHGAGFESQFSTVKLGSKAADGSAQYGLNVNTATGETLSFTATDVSPAMYVLGNKSLVKFQDGSVGSAPPPAPGALSSVAGQAYDRALAQAGSIGQVHAAQTGADGSIYILADVTGGLTNQPIKGAQDVALFKYDSAGSLVFQRTVGAAASASGLALAVGADGRIAVGGSVTGALGDGVKDQTQSDAFVTLFDDDGAELKTIRTGSSSDDSVNGLTFGADGTLYVAGKAGSALPGQVSQGGTDAYLSAYDTGGVLRSTTQYGGAGDDAAQALAVEDLGGGVQRVTIGANENGKLILRQFSDDGATVTAGATRDLGALVNGNIAGLAIENGALYVAGNVSGGGIDAGAVASAYGGGKDGFVAKIAADLTADSGDRVSYIGGTGDDSIAGFAVLNGEIYVGGDSASAFGGQSTLTDRDGFTAKLDTNGALTSTKRFAEGGKTFTASAFAFDAAGASSLDLLGLPSGAINVADTDLLTSRTSLLPGDKFSISVNGRGAQTITIAADDTIAKLVDKVQKAILSGGTTVGNFASNAQGLKITPATGAKITLIAGPAGADALKGLGLVEGAITPAPSTKTTGINAKKPPPSYGLGLASTLTLDSKLSAKTASDQLSTALITVQNAFAALSAPPTSATSGKVPAYLTQQLANYKAALARLTGSA